MTAQILSMHAGHAPDFGKIQTEFPQKMDTTSGAVEPPTPASPDRDDNRGRRREREEADGDHNGEGNDGGEATGSSRKRRRSRKGLDKKFECPHEGCGKSYSRAEHLYRHQLNRKSLRRSHIAPPQITTRPSPGRTSTPVTAEVGSSANNNTADNPKQIYHCDFPDCHRSFVRQDLCARHKERHTARGSQLLRKDTFMQNLNPIVTAAMANKSGTANKLGPMKDSPVKAALDPTADALLTCHRYSKEARSDRLGYSPLRPQSQMRRPQERKYRRQISIRLHPTWPGKIR